MIGQWDVRMEGCNLSLIYLHRAFVNHLRNLLVHFSNTLIITVTTQASVFVFRFLSLLLDQTFGSTLFLIELFYLLSSLGILEENIKGVSSLLKVRCILFLI